MPLKPSIVSASESKINLLLYGSPGVGKTTLASTAQDHPKMAPVLFINLEGGLLSVAGRGDIHSVNITSIAELEELFWAIKKKDPEYDQYNTFIIDSGSEMQQLSLQEAVIRQMRIDAQTAKRPDRTVDQIYIEDYGYSTAQMKRLFRWFRDLDKHVIITALPTFVFPQGDREQKSPIEVRPSFTEKLSAAVTGYVDFCWYMYNTDDGERYILTRTKGIYRAKTRGQGFAEALGETVTAPYLPTIYDLLLSSENGVQPLVEPQPESDIPVMEGDAIDIDVTLPVAEEEVPFR